MTMYSCNFGVWFFIIYDYIFVFFPLTAYKVERGELGREALQKQNVPKDVTIILVTTEVINPTRKK
jgi:hypothetical protein